MTKERMKLEVCFSLLYLIKMDLRGTGWGSMEWIHLAQDKDQWPVLVNTVMNLRVS
jgi:hypothetical protein